jgi:3-hydroxyacyl-CoA dehydrogenase
MKLEGKAFIITGGAGSIGGAAARTIIAEGGIAVVSSENPRSSHHCPVLLGHRFFKLRKSV